MLPLRVRNAVSLDSHLPLCERMLFACYFVPALIDLLIAFWHNMYVKFRTLLLLAALSVMYIVHVTNDMWYALRTNIA